MMQIKKGNLVTLSYRLYIDNQDGELIEETNTDEPYTLIIGNGEQLEAFEKKLVGLSEGDSYSFGLSTDEAFGPIDKGAIAKIPKSAFEQEGKIDENLFKMHKLLPMKDEEGNEFSGVIIAIEEENITMDFNHPLAGDNIWFEGKVLAIKAVN